MLVFGPLSSVFDYFTFAALGAVPHAGEREFHTGWFVESVVSATLVIFAVRTRLPAHRSPPGRAMALAAAAVVAGTIALPYTPVAAPLGLGPLPAPFLLILAGIVAAYVLSVEGLKRVFYRRVTG